jgi:flagellar hook-associated protein 1 FlgK
MATSVNTINGLLAQFQNLDATVASGSVLPDEKAAALDQRDAILKQLAAEIGIRTTTRPDGGMAIYTDSGVTLYDKVARNLTFAPTSTMAPGTQGNAVYADGVPIAGAASPMPSKSGRLAALANLRDNIAPTYQSQIDEVARGLVTVFAEKDQSATPGLPDATGLFSYSGSPTVPAAGTLVPGLAGTIKLNSAFDAASGGNPFLLRDGGANGAAYVYNTGNLSGFQDRLSGLIAAMGQAQNFSTATKLPTSGSLANLAAASAGWVEAGRSDADKASTDASAAQSRAKDALSRATGVNLDEEMSTLLSLEKSYQASAKMLTTVDQMLGDLMNVVR